MTSSTFSLSLECDEGYKPRLVRQFMIPIDQIFAAKLRFDGPPSLYDGGVVITSANWDRDKPMPRSRRNEINKRAFIGSVGTQ